MKKSFIALLLTFIFSIAIAAPTPINRIVAIVNNGVITQTQLNKQIEFVTYNLKKHDVKLPPENALQDQVLNQMVNNLVQTQRAKKTGIRVTQTEISKAIANVASRNHQKPSQLYADVAKSGLNKADFRTQIKNQLLIHKLQQRDVASSISVTPEEVKEYLRTNAGEALNKTEYHLENITVALPDSPTPQQIDTAKMRAELIVNELRKGKNFKTLAVSESKGSKALSGGDLGWKRLLQLPNIFAAKVTDMQVGDITNPIRTPDGFHILKLAGTRHANHLSKMDKAQLTNQVREILFQEKIQQKLQNWVGQLRSSSYVKILLNNNG